MLPSQETFVDSLDEVTSKLRTQALTPNASRPAKDDKTKWIEKTEIDLISFDFIDPPQQDCTKMLWTVQAIFPR